ncbi:MAG: NAD(P)/FAD-dependent oxidoreductase, partial [Halobacteriaceae archaeon]
GIDLAAVCGSQDIDAHYLSRGNRWWRYGLSEDGAEIIHNGLRDMGVTPVFNSGADRFEVEDGKVVATIDANGDRYESDFVGVAIGLNFNTEFIQDTDIEIDQGIVVDEYMRTSVDDIYAAGDITRFYDITLDAYAQNGAWGSAKQQGVTAAKTMVAEEQGKDDLMEAFDWVSSYSITHFDFPFMSFGFPDLGDDDCERKYSETEWRRLAFKDGRLIGGVLIGDLSPQRAYKKLIREKRTVADQKDVLLEKSFDPEKLAPTQEQ